MHYLFVHGSWHGQWCWEKIPPFFHDNGHFVSLFDLPGSGERFSEINEVTFEKLLDAVEFQIQQIMYPFCIIAHSFAGLLVAPLAEKYAKQIEQVFYLAAWLPQEGKSLIDMAIEFNNSELPTLFVPSGNPSWTAIDPIGAKKYFIMIVLKRTKILLVRVSKLKINSPTIRLSMP